MLFLILLANVLNQNLIIKFMKKKYFYSFIILSIMVMNSCKNKEKVNFILHNATVYTVNESFDTVSAFAVQDGKFVAIGTEKEILENYVSDNIVDAQKRAVYPGFNDGHSHFLGYGIGQLLYANLVGTQSFEEIIGIVVEHSKKGNAEWVLGRGWDQNDWESKEFPSNEQLDILFPDKPVVLSRIDGHAVIANSEALKRAGINAETKIDGGEIILVNGKPSGVLVDNAIDLVAAVIPQPDKVKKNLALLEAQEQCFAVGLTTVSDAGLSLENILLIDSLQQQGQLKMKVYAMMEPSQANFDYFFPKGPYRTGKLTVSSIKLYVDGALGSRGALLLEPYSDDPGNRGLQLNTNEYYKEICDKAYAAGFQVNTHAIGDSGNRLMLETYAVVLKGKNDKRWRVEHAQIVEPSDLHYFGDYSIIPSVQSTHCTSDMYWAGDRLGSERIKTAYAYKDLLEQNGWLVNGTDFPVENINPVLTFYAAVARKDVAGWPEEGFQTENALTREEALRSITIWPAKGSFDDNVKGSIEAGKAADFVILDQDLMKVPEAEIPEITVKATYVDGVQVFGEK